MTPFARNSLVAFLLLLLAAFELSPQTVITPTGIYDLGLGLNPARREGLSSPERQRLSREERSIVFFAASALDGDMLLQVRRAGVGPAGASDLVVLSKKRAARHVAEIPSGGRVLSASSPWVLISDAVRGSSSARLLNTDTNESREVQFTGSVLSATIKGGRLAVLTSGSGHAPAAGSCVLVILQWPTMALLHEVPLPNVSVFSSLHFVTETSLLLTEAGELSFTPIAITDEGVKMKPTVHLSGPEVDNSRARIRERSRSPNLRERYLLAYVPGADDTHFFFLAPFNKREGLRLVGFDERGQQVNSFRLTLHEQADGRPISPVPELVSFSGGDLLLAGQDGLVRTYRRPQ